MELGRLPSPPPPPPIYRAQGVGYRDPRDQDRDGAVSIAEARAFDAARPELALAKRIQAQSNEPVRPSVAREDRVSPWDGGRQERPVSSGRVAHGLAPAAPNGLPQPYAPPGSLLDLQA